MLSQTDLVSLHHIFHLLAFAQTIDFYFDILFPQKEVAIRRYRNFARGNAQILDGIDIQTKKTALSASWVGAFGKSVAL